MSDEVQHKPGQEEAFINRWSKRKLAAEQAPEPVEPEDIAEAEPVEALSDADMPPLESLDENADYSGFLSPKVSEGLRQQALKRLFSSACFNVCDGLDDYDEDFTQFEKLGDLITADLRHRMEQEAKRAREKAQQEALAQEDEAVQEQSAESTSDAEDSEPRKMAQAEDLSSPHSPDLPEEEQRS